MSEKTYTRNFFPELGRYAYLYAEEDPKFMDQVKEIVGDKKVRIESTDTVAKIIITPDATPEEEAAIQQLVDTHNAGGEQ